MKPHGVLCVDKPEGWTSQRALNEIKRLFQIRKLGHGGTLDPFATGMLPVFLGEATRYAEYVLGADKTYQFTVALGTQTDTGDPTGQVIASAVVPVFHQQAWQAACDQLLGSQQQLPPIYSALKHEGRPLYEWARQGKAVQKPARTIQVHDLRCQEVSLEQVTCCTRVSKGTYIRVLAETLAKKMGTVGHTVMLRRCAVDPFLEQDMVTFETLAGCESVAARWAYVHSLETLFQKHPSYQLDAAACRALSQGQRLAVHEADRPEGIYPVLMDGEFQGLVRLAEQRLQVMRWMSV